MKKTVLSLVLAACLLLAASCNNNKPVQNPTSDDDKTTTTTSTSATTPDEGDSDATTTAPDADSDATTAGDEDAVTTDGNGVANTTNTTKGSSKTNPTRRPDRTSNTTTAKNGVEIDPVNRGEKETAAPQTIKGTEGATYTLKWQEEFSKQGIDYNKIRFSPETNGTGSGNLLLLDEKQDPSIATADDGLLKMNARRYVSDSNPGVQYATSQGMSTKHTMQFKYGYVEMRAMVPIRRGAFSAFWSQGDPGSGLLPSGASGSHRYFVEIDFFEEFGSSNTIVPNYHKWYDNGDHSNFDQNHSKSQWEKFNGLDWNGKSWDWKDTKGTKWGNYTFENTLNLPYEFHLYTVEWTPKFMKFAVDGEVYATIDVNFNYDEHWTYGPNINADTALDHTYMMSGDTGAGHDGMGGYHDYIFLLLQNLIYANENDTGVGETGSVHEDHIINEDTVFPYQYWVDYIRLYQDANVAGSGLYYRDSNGNVVDAYAK